MARGLVVAFKTFLFFLLLPLLVPFLLVSHAWRLVASKVLIRLVPNSGRILTCRSSLSGTDGIYTWPKYSLVVVSIFEGKEPLEVITSAVSQRVVEAVDGGGRLVRPEFQQFVSSRFGFLFWAKEDQFRIEEHVRLYDGKYVEEFRGQELRPEMLMRVANELTYKPFKAGTSPWEVIILHNYRESAECPLSTVCILHAHHCLGLHKEMQMIMIISAEH